jgi:hypothetical protein
MNTKKLFIDYIYLTTNTNIDENELLRNIILYTKHFL